MKYFDQLDKTGILDLLVKNWMTHDAMWFATVVKYCGIVQANLLNRAALRALARVEAKRLQQAFGIEEIRCFVELKTASKRASKSSAARL